VSGIRNLRAVQRALLKVAAQVEAAAPAAEHAGAEIVAAKARANAPRRTGRGAASIHAEGGKAIVGEGYMRFPEEGTVNMAAEPFLAPAAEGSKGEVALAMAGIFRRAVR
jgi:HK97 gp10 family phage protein